MLKDLIESLWLGFRFRVEDVWLEARVRFDQLKELIYY